MTTKFKFSSLHTCFLKVSCLKEEVCKVGFPITVLEKYMSLTEEKDYSYVVYFFDQQKEELTVIKRYVGKEENQVKERQVDCYVCVKSTKAYNEENKYIVIVRNLHFFNFFYLLLL